MKSTQTEIIALYDNVDKAILNSEFKLLFAKYITLKELIKKCQPRTKDISKFLNEQLKLVKNDIPNNDMFIPQLKIIDSFFN